MSEQRDPKGSTPGRCTAREVNGFHILHGLLDWESQRKLVAACLDIARQAPFITPTMADGRPFRVEMTNAGEWGWLSDRAGYRYARHHPLTGRPWPPPPDLLRATIRHALAETLGGAVAGAFDPQCYLINRYSAERRGRLGLHRDQDERDRSQPIVTLSLGADAVFMAGGAGRRDPVERVTLRSGDVVVMGAGSRMSYHGIERLLPTLASPMDQGVRLSVTVRRVDPAA